MAAAEGVLFGITPELDRHVHADSAQKASGILGDIATRLSTEYTDEHHTEAQALWSDWESQVVSPLSTRPLAPIFNHVELPVKLAHRRDKARRTGAKVSLDFIVGPETSDEIAQMRKLERETWGERYAWGGNIYFGVVYSQALSTQAHQEWWRTSAKTVGVPIESGETPIDQPLLRRLVGVPKRKQEYVSVDGVREAAREQLETLWQGSRFIGMAFAVKGGEFDLETLASSVVSDPSADIEWFNSEHQEQLAMLNPYTRLTRRIEATGPGTVLDLAPGKIIDAMQTRNGRKSLEVMVRSVARLEERAVKRLLSLTDQVLEAVVQSPEFGK